MHTQTTTPMRRTVDGVKWAAYNDYRTVKRLYERGEATARQYLSARRSWQEAQHRSERDMSFAGVK